MDIKIFLAKAAQKAVEEGRKLQERRRAQQLEAEKHKAWQDEQIRAAAKPFSVRAWIELYVSARTALERAEKRREIESAELSRTQFVALFELARGTDDNVMTLLLARRDMDRLDAQEIESFYHGDSDEQVRLVKLVREFRPKLKFKAKQMKGEIRE